MMLYTLSQERARDPKIIAAACEYAAIENLRGAAPPERRSRIQLILMETGICHEDLLTISAANTPAAA